VPSSRPRLAAVALIPFLALGLTGCFGSGGSGSGGNGSVEVGTEPPSSFTTPVWANEVAPHGDWLTSVADNDLRIDVYQVAIEAAPEGSSWAFQETDEPLFVAGDPIVILEFVLTNLGDDDIVLPSGEAELTANYAGLNLSSVPAENAFEDLVESLGVARDGAINFQYSNDNDYQGLNDSWDMPVETGESVSWHAVYVYLEDDAFTLDFRLWRYVDGEFDYSDAAFESWDVTIPFA
jgi:hypothetical protein